MALLFAAGAAAVSPDPAPAPAKAAGGSPSDILSVLQAVKQAQSDVRDISFSFIQKTTLKGAGEPQEVRGKIIMTTKPERFRVDYESPVRQVALYDGKTILIYMPETGQAFRQKAGGLDLKKMLGFDPTAPLGAFEGRYSPELNGCAGGTCRITFKPGDQAGTVWTVALESGKWLVSEISFENSDMSMSIICSGYQLNRGLKAKAFRFRLPPDTEVVEGLPMLMGPGKAP
jgi:outer membrane lipoprotein-sorting protein